MKKQFIIANWKSHKTIHEAKLWFEEMSLHLHELGDFKEKDIIVCPPFPILHVGLDSIKKHSLPLLLGAQDISPFPEGSYTGAVSGKLLREFVTHTIIGHSESRRYLHQTEEELAKKVAMALSFGIMPIYCVSNKEEKIPQGVKIVAYEPLEAIGSGKPEEPQETESIAHSIKEKNSVSYILYGGSVTAENVQNYTQLPSVDGVLVGGESLNAQPFTSIIQNA